jgi:hypothetical protein
MLDVHPPHESAHTWRDFFIHIATIVVGLIIAVGLEQSVELIHHHHQRNELLEQLDAEHRQVIKDAEAELASEQALLNWYALHIEALRASIAQRPYQAPPPYKRARYNIPAGPVWLAAKANGLTSLLSQQIVIVNSESGQLIDRLNAFQQEYSRIRVTMLTPACGRLPLLPGSLDTDYPHADNKELRDCLAANLAVYAARRAVFINLSYIIGAEKATLAGETDIDRIDNLEIDESQARAAKLQPLRNPD